MITQQHWDDRYESVLTTLLPRLGAELPLRADRGLRGAGLDSMAVVELLIRLEDAYQVAIPDEELGPEAFETVGSLWTALARQLDAAGPR
ncbi:phosphopantetheine-binding protein [Streptomyces sp. NBC_00083]|uniref:phosphopantetheine-binding protein n=1 Tax=Streptomyces sp. NBC_00083 TaxID=2975647 RepID=UPI002250DF26|nr:phosphopantetheine-binding protein [Streptomyces sp. NBC_00083]MCX5387054.1 phosphopantetheine-binding protein [Streptomyces sp. NBC_00083]